MEIKTQNTSNESNRNAIHRLKSDVGVYITEPDLIAKEITNDFNFRYRKDPRCHVDAIRDLPFIQGVITPLENEFLTSEFTNTDIRDTVFL